MTNHAKRLIRKREAAKLSQSQLAVKAKLKNQSIIGMLESGARKTSSHLPAIAGLSRPLLQPDNYRLLLINSQQSLIYRTPSVYGNNFVQKNISFFVAK